MLPSIDDIAVHGSGDSTINGFSGERIEVDLNGSGNVKFNGRFSEVKAGIHGSGEAGNERRQPATRSKWR